MPYGHPGAGGAVTGMYGGNGVGAAPPGVPPYPLHPTPMRPPGPAPFAPPLQPGLPSAAPRAQHPPPPYPPALPPGGFPPMPPMYMQGGYGAYGTIVGGAPYWQPPAQLPFAPPPPPGVGDWRAPPLGAYPAAMPIGLGVGGGAMPVGLAGLAWAPPAGHPPMGATGGPPPGPVPSSEARRAQLAQLEDGDVPSSAAALQRRLEDLQLGREAATGEAADAAAASSPDDDLNGVAGEASSEPATSGGPLRAAAADEHPRLAAAEDGGGRRQHAVEPGPAAVVAPVSAPHGVGSAASRLDGRSSAAASSSGPDAARSLTHSTNGGPLAESHASPQGVPPSSSGSASAPSPSP